MGKKIVFLTPYLQGARGNVTTAKRFAHSYQAKGYEVELFAYAEQEEKGKERVEALLQTADYVQILHITRFAQWQERNQVSLSKPYLLTMGGTDIHLDFENGIDRSISELIEQAKWVTLFSPAAQEIMLKANPKWREKVKVIPQAILLPITEGELLSVEGQQKRWSGLSNSCHLLFPTGLRQVKDVLHLLPAWQFLAKEMPKFRVTIVGEKLEEQVWQEVEAACQQNSFLHYLPEVPFLNMGRLYAQADIVINTSKEEGQPTAICEAMGLGIPVIVRKNAGNISIVQHLSNGLVYQEPNQFIQWIHYLSTHPTEVEQMIQRAKRFIRQELSIEKEIERYMTLLLSF